MKKIGLLIAVLAAVVLAVEVDTWYADPTTGAWIHQDPGNLQALARLWNQYPTGGVCNKQNWSFNFTTNASMAQWIEWSISGSEWKWQIRKVGPDLCMHDGYYTGDCITFTVKSNYDVLMGFSGFGNLYNPTSIDQYIEVWYMFSNSNEPAPRTDPGWIPAASLNNTVFHFVDSQDLHDGLSYKFWNYIHVTNCNSACEYTNTGTITLQLQLIKPWIDPATGYFAG
jgi:hypothetical protein